MKSREKLLYTIVQLQETYPARYPQTVASPSVNVCIRHLLLTNYNPKTIKKLIEYIVELITQQDFSLASELLMVCVATEDVWAKYILAKELFIGELFQRNIAASFGLFSSLSADGFAPASYDVAYFYKKGIVVKKDKQEARNYYALASQQGLKYTPLIHRLKRVTLSEITGT